MDAPFGHLANLEFLWIPLKKILHHDDICLENWSAFEVA